jgi:hypothetical protein
MKKLIFLFSSLISISMICSQKIPRTEQNLPVPRITTQWPESIHTVFCNFRLDPPQPFTSISVTSDEANQFVRINNDPNFAFCPLGTLVVHYLPCPMMFNDQTKPEQLSTQHYQDRMNALLFLISCGANPKAPTHYSIFRTSLTQSNLTVIEQLEKTVAKIHEQFQKSYPSNPDFAQTRIKPWFDFLEKVTTEATRF